MTRERFESGSPQLRQGYSFSKVYTRLRTSEGPIENINEVFFILCLNYYTLYFENYIVLLISAMTLTSGIFTHHTPTNISLTLSVAV